MLRRLERKKRNLFGLLEEFNIHNYMNISLEEQLPALYIASWNWTNSEEPHAQRISYS
jgi:hypothetical protein